MTTFKTFISEAGGHGWEEVELDKSQILEMLMWDDVVERKSIEDVMMLVTYNDDSCFVLIAEKEGIVIDADWLQAHDNEIAVGVKVVKSNNPLTMA